MPKQHVDEVCKLGQGADTCAFLVLASGWNCAKGSNVESILRGRLERGEMKAKGDNCEGWANR